MSEQARVLIEELGLELTVRPVGRESPAAGPPATDDRMALVARLAGGIAHEMNNVLTAIAGYNALILSRMSESNPLRRDALEIEKAVDRAGELMRQLLAVAQRQVDLATAFELDGFVERLEPRLRRIAGPGVGVTVATGAAGTAVRASAEQLGEALALLVASASTAMEGQGRLRIETSTVETEPGNQAGVPPGTYARLSVTDSAPLPDEDLRGRIFEPFVAAPGSGRGAGLELATVFGLVAQNGGTVALDGTAAEGTTFAIHLPAVAEQEAPPVAARTAEVDRRETVLLADDETIVREVVRQTLERFGYEVLEAADGPEALEVAERHAGSIDLLLTDVRMPRMNGIELAGRLRTTRPRLRVLFMSGFAEADLVDELEQRPGMHFVDKPMTPSVLLARVREALDAERDGPPE